jgi:cytochrome c556
MSHRSSRSIGSNRAGRFVPAFVALAGLAGSFAAPVVRAEGAPGASSPEKAVIEYRQMVMGAIGSNMGAIGGILKNQLALPGAVANHAQQMADAAKLIGPAFKQKVFAGKTDAKAEIWKDWAKFERAISDYEKAATALASAAKGSDPAATGAAVKALGESCGGCHDSFRKPKEESFRNRR